MLVNDIKKGMRVHLANGWFGTMADNKKGNIRMVDVEGIYREIGSVYSHEIAWVRVDGDRWERVELSPAQKKTANKIMAMGF
jgi:hypothetical protein